MMRETTNIDGIDCVKIETGLGKKPKSSGESSFGRDELWGAVPLPWLKRLPAKSGMTKVSVLLWAYGRMAKAEWFSVSNKVFTDCGVSSSRKNIILRSLEATGAIELRATKGKAYEIRLIQSKETPTIAEG